MCGIAGWFGRSMGCEADSLLEALRHRGPDGEGFWHDPEGRALLVNTRLAILDPSPAGAQPMSCIAANRGGATLRIVFNGAIYNFRELRRGLEAEGETFAGESDTEVLLRLLARDGPAALPRLAGMFAFALYDSQSGHALLGRDPFGIKPLYYAERDGTLAFASEVKALRHCLTAGTVSSPAALRDTLVWGSVPEPSTVLEGVRTLPAGCFLEWDGATSRISRWHQLEFRHSSPPANAAAATRAALLESVQRHLVSDVPLGIFLSGGMDSTAILALTRESLGRHADIRTFSIGFADPAYDESAIARRTAAHFGATHTEWKMSAAEVRAQIAGYVGAMDQPTTDGLNTLSISKLARMHGVKVAFSGLGGDEMFGGYGSFRNIPRLLRMHSLLGPLRPVAAAALDRAQSGSRWRRLAEFFGGEGGALSAFHAQRGIFTEAEARELVRGLTGHDPGPADWSFGGLPDDLRDTASLLEITRYMRNQLLRDSDVFSMASGVELRVPFVDARLFDAISAIPAEVRLESGKQLLFDAVPEIPVWVREQPKRGFMFPYDELTDEFAEMAADCHRTTVRMVTWYRRWAFAAVAHAVEPARRPDPAMHRS